ncbi:MAG: hypothetical protein M3410_08095 [Acidobacteriota bacterium]|nr:hypothetical protein [Acidobacteriota bacterium]
MANCSLSIEPPGDKAWNKKRIWKWIGLGFALGVVLGYLQIADLGTPAGIAILYVIGFLILTGAAVGLTVGYIGNAWNWFRDRLKKQNPETITIAGLVVCKRRNLGGPNFFDPSVFEDGDWNFNVDAGFSVLMPLIPGLDANEVRTRAAPGSGQPQAFRAFQTEDQRQVLHTEISSRIGDCSVVGGAVGSVAGLVAGAILCGVLGLLTLGAGLLLCGLFMLAGAYLGGQIGGLIGSLVGEIWDEISDFDERGEVVEEGACMSMTGTWVTDKWHQWNEIHDVESAQIMEICGTAPAGAGVILMAAVGIGRHPTGRDP